MTTAEYRRLVVADLWRIEGAYSWRRLVRHLTRGMAFKFIFWMRTSLYCRAGPVPARLLYPLARALYRHYMFKLGISIPYTTSIGPGLYIGHFGGIVVSGQARIGANCNLSQNVTIGGANRGTRAGVASLGDNVYVGPGAVVVGRVDIGNQAAIGANAVVLDDVPEAGVVVGNPGRVVSHDGSSGYVNRTNYPQ